MAFVEAAVLALIERVTGVLPTDADALLDLVGLEDIAALKSGCPATGCAPCWHGPIALPIFGAELEQGRDVINKLVGRNAVKVIDAKSIVSCVGHINRYYDNGQNKLDLDVAMFERLARHATRHTEASVYCGMVGGIRDYRTRLQMPAEVLSACKGAVAYNTPGGTMRFEVDADARHLPVALASMLGKYVRELSMHRINTFYQARDPDLKPASGYHDPVTSAFIEATEPHRRALNIAPDCFERRA